MFAKNWLKLAAGVAASAVMGVLCGCGAGDLAAASGPLPVSGHLSISGGVHGGQQPIYHAVIGLWAAGASGYGMGATNLIGTQSSGGTCGPSMTTAITGFSITSNVVTFTTSAAVTVGRTLQISGLTTGTYLNGYTVTVLSATATSFTAAFTHADVGSTTDSGTATAVCATDSTGTFNITGDYSCPSATTQVYLTATGGDPTGSGANSTNNSAIQMVAALGACGNLSSSTFVQINEVTTVAAAYALAQFYGGFGGTDSIGAPSTNTNGLINAFATAHNLADTTSGYAAPTTAASGTNYSFSATDQQKIYTLANILSDCVNQTSSGATACTNLFNAVKTTNGTAPSNTFQAAVYMNLNPQSINSTDATGSTNRTTLFNMQSPYAPFAPSLSAAPIDWTLALQYSGTGINDTSSIAIDSFGDLWLTNANNTGGLVELNGGTGHNGGTAGVAGSSIGYYTGVTNNASLTLNPSQTRQVAVDINDKAWLANFASTNSTTLGSNTNTYYAFRATPGVGIDSYFGVPSGSADGYAVAFDPSNDEVFLNTTSCGVTLYTSSTAASATVMTKYNTSSMGCSGPSIVIDSTRTGYTANGTTMYQFNAGPYPPSNPTSTTGLTSFASPYGAALMPSGKILVANQTTGSYGLVLFDTTAKTLSTFSTSSCLKKPNFEAVDGSGNVWVSNNNTTADGTSGNFTVCEFDSSGNLLSPSIGYGSHAVQTGRGIAVDQSGNVWVTSYTAAATATLTQIVGAAAPAVQPIVAAVKNGTLGQRP